MFTCAACGRAVTEGSGREPHHFDDHAFCDLRCAQRWAYAQLPTVRDDARRYAHLRASAWLVILRAPASIAKGMLRELLKATGTRTT